MQQPLQFLASHPFALMLLCFIASMMLINQIAETFPRTMEILGDTVFYWRTNISVLLSVIYTVFISFPTQLQDWIPYVNSV